MRRLSFAAKRLFSWLAKILFGECTEDLNRAAAEQQQRINRRRRERMRAAGATDGHYSQADGPSSRDYEEWMNIGSGGRGPSRGRETGRDN